MGIQVCEYKGYNILKFWTPNPEKSLYATSITAEGFDTVDEVKALIDKKENKLKYDEELIILKKKYNQ